MERVDSMEHDEKSIGGLCSGRCEFVSLIVGLSYDVVSVLLWSGVWFWFGLSHVVGPRLAHNSLNLISVANFQPLPTLANPNSK